MRLGVKKQKGFTLIELSIVLIIIGLLLAAVMKGRDLIRSAQQKKFYNQFINAWVLAYQQFNDRTGYVLGGPFVYSATNQGNATDPSLIGCDKFLGTNTDLCIRDSGRWNNGTNSGFIKALYQAGLQVPPVTYEINFSKYVRTTAWILFGSDPLEDGENLTVYLNATAVNATTIEPGIPAHGAPYDMLDGRTVSSQSKNGRGRRGNFMLIVNLPYDVAAAIDKIIDGTADGRNGNFRCVKASSSAMAPWQNDGSVVDTRITDIGNVTNICGGAFYWGDPTNKYVTALYELEP